MTLGNHKYHMGDQYEEYPRNNSANDDLINNELAHTTNPLLSNNSTNSSFDDEVRNFTEPSVMFKVIAFLWLVNLCFCVRKTRQDEIERSEREERRRLEREEDEEKKRWLEPSRRKKEIEKQIVTQKIMIASDGTMSLRHDFDELNTCPMIKKNVSLPPFTIDDRYPTTVDANATTTSIIPMSPDDHEPVPNPGPESEPKPESESELECEAESESKLEFESELSTSIPNSLSTTITADNNTETTCSICLEDLLPSSSLSWSRQLHCHHVFHSSCLHSWLMTGRDECPVCRTILLRRQYDSGCEGGDEAEEEGGEREEEEEEEEHVDHNHHDGDRTGAIDQLVDDTVVIRRRSRRHRRRWGGRSYQSGSQVPDSDLSPSLVGSGTGGVREMTGHNIEAEDDIEADCSQSLSEGGGEEEDQQDTIGHREEYNGRDCATINDEDGVDVIVSGRRRKKNRKRYLSLQNQDDEESDEDYDRCLA